MSIRKEDLSSRVNMYDGCCIEYRRYGDKNAIFRISNAFDPDDFYYDDAIKLRDALTAAIEDAKERYGIE